MSRLNFELPPSIRRHLSKNRLTANVATALLSFALISLHSSSNFSSLNVSVTNNPLFTFNSSFSLTGHYRDWETDRKSTRLNSSHITRSRMPSSA